MVFQDPMTSLNPVMRIGKQITESLRYHLDVSKDYANETAFTLLQSVGIPEAERRLRDYPHQLSGGMRQRVMIAIALACGPKLLFADEPTTALDVTVQAQILDLLQAQQRERFMAMILVTHDLGVVAGSRRRHRGDVRGPHRREGARAHAVHADAPPVHRGAAQVDPEAEPPEPHPAGVDPGPSTRPPEPAEGLQVRPRCPYAQERCFQEEPPLEDHGSPGHEFACFYPVGTPEGDEAYAKNRAAGVPAAAAPTTAGETTPTPATTATVGETT